MGDTMEKALLLRIRVAIAFVIFGLVLSGVTAFPLETELRWLTATLGIEADSTIPVNGLQAWLLTVRDALIDTNDRYGFMAYGTDWLAFGHLVIALFFLGPLIAPQRNLWIIVAGLIACAGVIVLATIAGSVREIPWFWRLIDCSFGIVCAVPLLLTWRWVRQLDELKSSGAAAV